MINVPRPLFQSSKTFVTPMAIEALETAQTTAEDLLQRHFSGDWGVVDLDDAVANDDALQTGGRILSAYILETGVRVWILTEAASKGESRLTTTVLLPSEY